MGSLWPRQQPPAQQEACDWLFVNTSNVLISLVIWVLIPWLAVMKCKIVKMELRVGACLKTELTGSKWFNPRLINISAHCEEVSHLFALLFHSLWHFNPSCSSSLILRCVALRQRRGGTQPAWLWWTHLWTSCHVDASALSSSLRACSRPKQTVLRVWASADTVLAISDCINDTEGVFSLTWMLALLRSLLKTHVIRAPV